MIEVETGFEPVYAALQAAASPLGHSTGAATPLLRADDGIRTRDPHLGKVMLYQLSHVRIAPLGCDQNCSRSCRSRKLGLAPSVTSRSGIVRVVVHSAHALRALARRPSRAARPVICGRTSHFVAQPMSVIFRCRSKNS